MAMPSVSDFSTFINQQIQNREQLATYLWKLEALIAMALTIKDFSELSSSTLYEYFSIAGELINEASLLNQVNLNTLLTVTK